MKEMKQIIILFIAIVTTLTSNAQNKYTVIGSANEGVTKMYMRPVGENKAIDSTKISDNTFTLKGKVGAAQFVELIDNNGSLCGQFILEPGNITLLGNNYYGKGTPWNDAFTAIVDACRPYEDKASNKEITWDSVEVIYHDKSYKTIEDHLNDALGARTFHYFATSIGKFEFKSFFDRGGSQIQKDPSLMKIRSDFERTAKSEEGMMFTDFHINYDGEIQSLSDYVGKGKYILVDFWASWCVPCKKEIPNIIETYNKYKGDKFDVVGIATSDKPEDTKNAMEQLGIQYNMIYNNQGEASTPYGITSIPHIILFGPDGKILKRGLRGAEIMKAVSKYLDN